MTAIVGHELSLRIDEVAERVGVNPRTIRYYEDIGLMPEPVRRPSGYRIYGREDAERLAFIRRSKHLGLSLDEIQEVLVYREDSTPPCEFVLSVVRRHAGELEARIAELTRLCEEIAGLIDHADDTPGLAASYCRLLEPADA